jgi:hypothetical protein
MAEIRKPQRVLAFVGLIYVTHANVEAVFENLLPVVGNVLLRSRTLRFTHTSYYKREMGDNLARQWCVFDALVDPYLLIDLKHRTNELEQKTRNEHGGRQINIDPGLLSMSNIVLASTKNYAHRIYCGKGIYAEVTLLYQAKTFKALDWTYPDYREQIAIDFFCHARELLKEKIRGVDNV